jgi:hypothetical protein
MVQEASIVSESISHTPSMQSFPLSDFYPQIFVVPYMFTEMADKSILPNIIY